MVVANCLHKLEECFELRIYAICRARGEESSRVQDFLCCLGVDIVRWWWVQVAGLLNNVMGVLCAQCHTHEYSTMKLHFTSATGVVQG